VKIVVKFSWPQWSPSLFLPKYVGKNGNK
jgi:hypothetical protein